MNLLPFFEDDLNSHASRKRLAAAAKRRVGVYNQAGEPTTFQKKSRRERYIVRDDVSKSANFDTISRLICSIKPIIVCA